MILTPRNYLKQELEEQTKGFSFHIAEDNQKELLNSNLIIQ